MASLGYKSSENLLISVNQTHPYLPQYKKLPTPPPFFIELPPPPTPLIGPSLLSSASRFRRPSARRRQHPLPCLFSSLTRASFPLTKTIPTSLTRLLLPLPSCSPSRQAFRRPHGGVNRHRSKDLLRFFFSLRSHRVSSSLFVFPVSLITDGGG